MSPRNFIHAFLYMVLVAPLLVAAQTPGTDSAKTSPSASPKAADQSTKRRTDTIYGSQLMSPDERATYRENMLAAKTPEERERLRAEHHKEMQARAKERGVTLPDAPPARGRRGRGMGPRGGMGRGPGQGPANASAGNQ